MILSDVLTHGVNEIALSIFTDDNQALLAACVDPSYPSLTTIPYNSYWQNFQIIIINAYLSGGSQGLGVQHALRRHPNFLSVLLTFG